MQNGINRVMNFSLRPLSASWVNRRRIVAFDAISKRRPELIFRFLFSAIPSNGTLNFARWTGTPSIEFIVFFPLSESTSSEVISILTVHSLIGIYGARGLCAIFCQTLFSILKAIAHWPHLSLSLSLSLFILQEGSIGHDVVIKPVPAGIINADADSSTAAHHIVFKRKADPMDQLSDFGEFCFHAYSCIDIHLRCARVMEAEKLTARMNYEFVYNVQRPSDSMRQSMIELDKSKR